MHVCCFCVITSSTVSAAFLGIDPSRSRLLNRQQLSTPRSQWTGRQAASARRQVAKNAPRYGLHVLLLQLSTDPAATFTAWLDGKKLPVRLPVNSLVTSCAVRVAAPATPPPRLPLGTSSLLLLPWSSSPSCPLFLPFWIWKMLQRETAVAGTCNWQRKMCRRSSIVTAAAAKMTATCAETMFRYARDFPTACAPDGAAAASAKAAGPRCCRCDADSTIGTIACRRRAAVWCGAPCAPTHAAFCFRCAAFQASSGTASRISTASSSCSGASAADATWQRTACTQHCAAVAGWRASRCAILALATAAAAAAAAAAATAPDTAAAATSGTLVTATAAAAAACVRCCATAGSTPGGSNCCTVSGSRANSHSGRCTGAGCGTATAAAGRGGRSHWAAAEPWRRRPEPCNRCRPPAAARHRCTSIWRRLAATVAATIGQWQAATATPTAVNAARRLY